MAIITWTIRRYNLLEYYKSELDSTIKAWVQWRGCKIAKVGKLDIKRGLAPLSYSIAPPGEPAWKQLWVSIYVYYVDAVLYFCTTNHIPKECSGVNADCIEPYVLSQGGTVIDHHPLNLDGNVWQTPQSLLENHISNSECFGLEVSNAGAFSTGIKSGDSNTKDTRENLFNKLQALKELQEQGLISDQEYEEKKTEILSRL